MLYTFNYKQLKEALSEKDVVHIMYKTVAHLSDDKKTVIIRHHGNKIAELSSRKIKLSLIWRSFVTKRRFNFILFTNDLQYHIYSRRYALRMAHFNGIKYNIENLTSISFYKRKNRWNLQKIEPITKHIRTREKAYNLCRALAKIMAPLHIQSFEEQNSLFNWWRLK